MDEIDKKRFARYKPDFIDPLDNELLNAGNVNTNKNTNTHTNINKIGFINTMTNSNNNKP